MSKVLKILYFIFAIAVLAVFIGGCSNSPSNNDDDDIPSDTLWVNITLPSDGDTAVATLTVRTEVNATPDFIQFILGSSNSSIDYTSPFEATFDISTYSSGQYTLKTIARWGIEYDTDEISIYIAHLECSDDSVVLGGVAIPEDRVVRNTVGCVVSINLSEMGLSDSNCLEGLNEYSATLETLDLRWNSLTNIDISPLTNCDNLKMLRLSENRLAVIDLSPLAGCSHLWWLSLGDNNLDSLDVSPLASCTNLYWLELSYNNIITIDVSPLIDASSLRNLWLNGNDLDEASCATVCNFIEQRPDCYNVVHDCTCGKQDP